MDESTNKTLAMVIQYEMSYGTEALLKLTLSNLHKVLVEKGIITEMELNHKMCMEILADTNKRIKGI